MIETTAIRKVSNEPFLVTWDTGRRCNYDCTYCEAHRHNNFSRHRTLEELLKTFEFIREWSNLYKEDRTVNIDFTGGEPTVNPNFWALIEYIRKQPENYYLALTSNGTWGKKNLQNVTDCFDGVTISYHCEAADDIKQNVIDNIIAIKQSGKWVKVNLMMHVDYFEEYKRVYTLLKSHGVNVKLRPIGDGNVARPGWFIDTDGTNRRTSHEYPTEQQEWFWNEMGIVRKADKKTEGTEMGRACCGGRCIEGCVDNVWQPVNLIKTEFKGWYCDVDHYFLHIDQETELVYHHQTCQAKYNGERGSIGSLSNVPAMLEYAKNKSIIVCPNQRCGCGMCVPKAKELAVFNELRR